MSFIVRREPATDPSVKHTLLLLHGTGGTENDLVELGQSLLPGAGIVSPRGNVKESIYARWFRRFAEGVFDEDSIRHEAAHLAEFLKLNSARSQAEIFRQNGATVELRDIGAGHGLTQADFEATKEWLAAF